MQHKNYHGNQDSIKNKSSDLKLKGDTIKLAFADLFTLFALFLIIHLDTII